MNETKFNERAEEVTVILEGMRKTCGYVRQYKAEREPTCGCTSCWRKWVRVNRERAVTKYLESKRPDWYQR